MSLTRYQKSQGEFYSSVASICGSSVIILTYCLFPNLRKLRYVELVFYVSISDLFAACGTILGSVPDDSDECWFQGFSTSIGFLAAVLWTTVILHQIFLVVVQRGKVFKSMIPLHMFCWGWPIVLSLLPLSTNTYNNYDDQASWCFVASRSDSPMWGELFWTIFSFFFWIWLAIFVNVVQIVMVVRKLRNLQVSRAVRSTMRKLIWYPLMTMVCWFLVSIGTIHVIANNTSFEDVNTSWQMITIVGSLLAILQGFFNACFFITMNKIVREHWYEFSYRVYKLLFCCTFIAPAKDLRTKSTTSEFEGSRPPAMRDVSMFSEAELEMGRASRPVSHRDGKNPDDRHSQRDTLFRDSFMSNVSNYLSVSLPVDGESDYIGKEGDDDEEEEEGRDSRHAGQESIISALSGHTASMSMTSANNSVYGDSARPSVVSQATHHTHSTLHTQNTLGTRNTTMSELTQDTARSTGARPASAGPGAEAEAAGTEGQDNTQSRGWFRGIFGGGGGTAGEPPRENNTNTGAPTARESEDSEHTTNPMNATA